MYTFDIVIGFSKIDYSDDIEQVCFRFLESYYDTRQIVNDEYLFIKAENKIRIPVVCPEIDSLDNKNSTEYALRAINELEKITQHKIEFVQTGKEALLDGYIIPSHCDTYILYFGKFSPLLCGNSYDAIPLYKIPYTYHDNKCYNDLRTWYRNYNDVFNLWMRGSINENFFQEQMEDVNSELNDEGRELSKKIESLTKTPTYYWLFNYRNWGREKDIQRKCPGCGNDWLIKEKTFNDFIAFKCDSCRLVSELSSQN